MISSNGIIVANQTNAKLRRITLKEFKENSVKDFYTHTHGRHRQKKLY